MDLTDTALKNALQRQMQRQGIRRLVVLSGDTDWCAQQAMNFSAGQPGDWLWVSDAPPLTVTAVPFSAVHTLLGQERKHGVFDARTGLNVEALAAFAGTLQAGSWLLLLIPEWQQWAESADLDSLRWSEQPQAIATPNFIHRFQSIISQDNACTVLRQHQAGSLAFLTATADWTPPDGRPTADQQQILTTLRQADSGIWVLTAARGRGKSTLAGMLIADWPGVCWVTAPGKAATDKLAQQSAGQITFWAPDALLAHLEQATVSGVDWLLIDEAAAIPASQLARMVAAFPRALLTTTVQGYEGTGRGFLLKFCASLAEWHDIRLSAPVRWSSLDPLEPLLDQLLLFNDLPAVALAADPPLQPITLKREQWLTDPALLTNFYGLLTSAHYRTSPLDLRRLLDAPGMSFAASMQRDAVAGALWLVDEGGLHPALAHEIWAGRRRPRGNLVAQSLAAHGGQIIAPVLRSRRVSRIAVQPDARRQGVALSLLAQQAELAAKDALDFLSVSFGYTAELAAFWHRAGYRLVRLGTQREASSGCYAAMAVLPISAAGHAMADAAGHQLARDWHWLQRLIALELPFDSGETSALTQADWCELAGFAFAHRAIESSYAALQRLLLISPHPMIALRQYVQQGLSLAACAEAARLSGRKALLQRWRQEAALAMNDLDAQACSRWQHFSSPRNTP